ncbi:hypothetical protein T492DRAFT_896720, partial [Pavlovales sp. CCMP2436]
MADDTPAPPDAPALGALIKARWRKGYRAAVDGCASDSARAHAQSLFRALMTGKEPAVARTAARALVGSSPGGVAALAAGTGKEAHSLARLALAQFALEDGRPLEAIQHLDWSIITGMDRDVVAQVGLIEAAYATSAPVAADPAAAGHDDDDERRFISPPDMEAARNALGLPASAELERVQPAELTVADFAARYFRAGRPVVIAGAASNWPALQRWADLAYFVRV